MRTLDLLGAEAVDTDGRALGRVHDVRLETGAQPTQESGEPAFAICALVIGTTGYAHRLGYGRGAMAGPWPLTVLFRRLAQRSISVPWSAVDEVGEGRVTVRASAVQDAAGRDAT